MRWRRLLVAFALVACRKTHVECTDKPDESQMKAMIEEAKTNPRLCHEMGAPTISLTGDVLVLTGPKEYVLARRDALPLDRNPRIDGLDQGLRAYRNQYETIHPEEKVGSVELRFDPALETVRAVTVLLHLPYVPYAQAHVTTGATSVSLNLYQHLGHAYVKRLLFVEASDDAQTVTVSIRGPGCEPKPSEVVQRAVLRERIEQLCKPQAGACVDAVDVRLAPAAPFGESALVLSSIVHALEKQSPPPYITLLAKGIRPSPGFATAAEGAPTPYAPNIDDDTGHCLPDGGHFDDPRDGYPRFE